MEEKYELITLFGKPVLFTESRIRDEEVPDGLYRYETRYDDSEEGDMVELKDHILVNFLGIVISKEEFNVVNTQGSDFTIDEGIPVDETDYGYEGEFYTIEEYNENYDEILNKHYGDTRLQAATTACHLMSLLDSIDDAEFVDEVINCIASNDAFALGQLAMKHAIGRKDD